MKNIARKLMSLVLVLVLLVINFSTVNTTVFSKNGRVADTMTGSGLQVDTLYQTDNYATYYYYNLNENFGFNRYGSCSYIAIGMLLSYYDTYWSDSFIREDYDVGTPVPTFPTHSYESPGVASDYSYVEQYQSMNFYQYYMHVYQNNDYFQFWLINNYGIPNGYHGPGDSTFGLNEDEVGNVLTSYINYKFSSGVSVQDLTKSTNALTYGEIADSIDAGDPVLLTAYKEDGGHAMIAYDYSVDSSGKVDEIYVHMGYLRDDPPTGKRTHVALSTTGYTNSLRAYSLNVTIPHSCSNNYYNDDDENPTSFCSCCFSEHPEHAGHEHYNVYLPYNKTTHKLTCAFCSRLEYRAHVVAAGSLNITRCLDCGALVSLELNNGVLQGVIENPGDTSSIMGTTIPDGAEIFTENGSYILSNGIVVLAEADVELYLKGELAIPE